MKIPSEQEIMEALNAAEGRWEEVPFPPDKVPEGHTATALRGNVDGKIFLLAKYTTPTSHTGHDGTCVWDVPFMVMHVTRAVAEAGFLKGEEWLKKQKSAA